MSDIVFTITAEGERPCGLSREKSGAAVKLSKDASPEEWLLHLRTALDALYKHEAQKLKHKCEIATVVVPELKCTTS